MQFQRDLYGHPLLVSWGLQRRQQVPEELALPLQLAVIDCEHNIDDGHDINKP